MVFVDIMCNEATPADISKFWQIAISIHCHGYNFFGYLAYLYGFFIGSISILYCNTFRLRFIGFILSSIAVVMRYSVYSFIFIIVVSLLFIMFYFSYIRNLQHTLLSQRIFLLCILLLYQDPLEPASWCILLDIADIRINSYLCFSIHYLHNAITILIF